MSTKRLWLISGAAVAAVAVLVLLATLLVPQSSEAEATPTPTRTTTASAAPSPSATQTASATPSPTPTAVVATCENTSTDVFRAIMASNGGWVSWETQGQLIGSRPFDGFPNGSPRGTLVCRWGADPNLATDDIIDLAWAPIDPENAVAAMQMLVEHGYVRTETPDAISFSLTGPEGYTDADGWGETYTFTSRDVRWAATRADVDRYVKAPTEVG